MQNGLVFRELSMSALRDSGGKFFNNSLLLALCVKRPPPR